MKLIRVIQSKIVKKDNKYQVQSEKGKNLGTYDTKEQAEKRLKQVEMFKHMKSSLFTAEDLENLWNNRYDYWIDEIESNYIYMTIITEDEVENKLVISIDYDLASFVPAMQGTSNPYLADTPEEYYGTEAYYEDFKINKITIVELNGEETNIEIPLDSNFSNGLYNLVEEHYRFPKE